MKRYYSHSGRNRDYRTYKTSPNDNRLPRKTNRIPRHLVEYYPETGVYVTYLPVLQRAGIITWTSSNNLYQMYYLEGGRFICNQLAAADQVKEDDINGYIYRLESGHKTSRNGNTLYVYNSEPIINNVEKPLAKEVREPDHLVYPSPKHPKVYNGAMKVDVDGSIGNSPFKAGTKVKVAIAATGKEVEFKAWEMIKANKAAFDAMDDFEKAAYRLNKINEALADPAIYSVWVLGSSESGRVLDLQLSTIIEGMDLIKLDGTADPSLTPFDIVTAVIDNHNKRVW